MCATNLRVKEHMKEAIREARKGIRAKEGGPFGAVIVRDGKVLAIAHNTVLLDSDPTAHAEVNAIQDAAKEHGIDLSGCEIYSTAEPCPMCFAAIHWAGIDTVIYGASIEDATEHGFRELALKDREIIQKANLPIKLVSGFLRAECRRLFDEYDEMGGKKY